MFRMEKAMKKFLLFLLLTGSIFVIGQDQKLFTVDARGVGVSPEAAAKDALAQAILQVAMVDSYTLMKNDKVIQEKILAAGNAIIKKYDVVVPASKNRYGLYEIRIRAQVEQNLLKQKLIENKIVTGKVEGSQNFWAELVTQEKNRLDMDVMIENTISNIDFNRYLIFNLVGVAGTRGSQTKPYMRQDPRDKRKIHFAVGVVCYFDADRFQQECMPHLKKIFDFLPFAERRYFVSERKTERKVFAFPPDRWGGFIMSGEKRYENQLEGRKVAMSWTTAQEAYYDWRVFNREHDVGILLDISPRYQAGSQQFAFYVCSRQSWDMLTRLVRKKQSEIEKISASVCLLDGAGNEVRRMTIRFASSDARFPLDGVGCVQYPERLVISPEFHRRGLSHSVEEIFPLSTVIDVEELKEIKSFKLEVVKY